MNSLPTTGLQQNLSVIAARPLAKLSESLAASEIDATPEIEQLRRCLRKIQLNLPNQALAARIRTRCKALHLITATAENDTQRAGALPKRSDWDETKHSAEQTEIKRSRG
jgi:hypothetical protein